MKLSELSMEQVRQYFGSRLQNVKPTVKQVTHCPFHSDSSPSFSLNLDKGVWKCHACNIGGGLIDFEMQFSKTDRKTAYAEICRVLGLEYTESISTSAEEPEAIYPYRDARNRVLFEKLRYPGKRFLQRCKNEHGRWEFRLPPDLKKPLYNLPELITANVAVICEGEKDCDNVTSLGLAQHDEEEFTKLAVTTNFDGAGKWDIQYSPFFTGKLVFILPDNDAVGKSHAKTLATAIAPYAFSVKIVELPELTEKGDVSDYLQTHTSRDLWDALIAAKRWQVPKSTLLIPAPAFLERQESEEIDWLVEGVVQVGANGFIVAAPKVGKSWASLDMAISIALGESWLGMKTKKASVALISREDTPNLTRWRMAKLLAGRECYAGKLEESLWINSKDQSPQFRIDDPTQLAEMIDALRAVKPDLIILDVFNILHTANENDSTEMRKVMDSADMLHRELKASVCILHHFNKGDEGRLTGRIRGSSAISGWAEWVIGLRFASDENEERERIMQFELKAGESREQITYTIETEGGKTQFVVANKSATPKKPRKKSKADEFLS